MTTNQFYCYNKTHFDLLLVVVFFLGKAVNQLPVIPAIFDSYCQDVFAFIQPC